MSVENQDTIYRVRFISFEPLIGPITNFSLKNIHWVIVGGESGGRACAVFCHLNKIIPSLREVLNNRDYLYRVEIEAIDNILYEYNDVIKIIWVGLLDTFIGLVSDEVEDEFKTQEE